MYLERNIKCSNRLLVIFFIALCLNRICGNDITLDITGKSKCDTISNSNEKDNSVFRSRMAENVQRRCIQGGEIKKLPQDITLNRNPNFDAKVKKINRNIYRDMGHLSNKKILSSDFIERKKVFENPSSTNPRFICKQSYITPFGRRVFYNKESDVTGNSTCEQNTYYDLKKEENISQKEEKINNQFEQIKLTSKTGNTEQKIFSQKVAEDEEITNQKNEKNIEVTKQRRIPKNKGYRVQENEFASFMKALKNHIEVFRKVPEFEEKYSEELKQKSKETKEE
ncbi:hypothetical protein CWI39_0306p0010 [Hamiltosporidium magnivora]|uniref:Uncharacterized protein n=1 Tax=Hamiltosporidium magnivora TaxID=148818 RepID=A0A4Q9LHC6_9MICR|nr:hypothetical protein CWI39_0306p0010 [Hamiltosporidium magnivora]